MGKRPLKDICSFYCLLVFGFRSLSFKFLTPIFKSSWSDSWTHGLSGEFVVFVEDGAFWFFLRFWWSFSIKGFPNFETEIEAFIFFFFRYFAAFVLNKSIKIFFVANNFFIGDFELLRILLNSFFAFKNCSFLYLERWNRTAFFLLNFYFSRFNWDTWFQI